MNAISNLRNLASAVAALGLTLFASWSFVESGSVVRAVPARPAQVAYVAAAGEAGGRGQLQAHSAVLLQ
jgi:hypothetical protein